MKTGDIVVTTLLVLAGAAVIYLAARPPETTVDQCLRRELFASCIAHGVNSEGLVEACASSAYYHALGRRDDIAPACRTQ